MFKDLNSKTDLTTFNEQISEVKAAINRKASTDVATTTTNGLMYSRDKSKLDTIQENANYYVHPTGSGNFHIPEGGRSGDILKWTDYGKAKWDVPDSLSISVFNRNKNGLVPSPTGTTSNRFLCENGNWVVPPTSTGPRGTSMRYKGEWNSSTEYVTNNEYIDLVTYEGELYICIATNTNQPVQNPNYWDLAASKGEKGDKGEQGEPGSSSGGSGNGPSYDMGFGEATPYVSWGIRGSSGNICDWQPFMRLGKGIYGGILSATGSGAGGFGLFSGVDATSWGELTLSRLYYRFMESMSYNQTKINKEKSALDIIKNAEIELAPRQTNNIRKLSNNEEDLSYVITGRNLPSEVAPTFGTEDHYVDMVSVSSLSWKAISELLVKIETLEKKIEELENK